MVLAFWSFSYFTSDALVGMFITIYQCPPKAVRWPYGFISPLAARASSISSTRGSKVAHCKAVLLEM